MQFPYFSNWCVGLVPPTTVSYHVVTLHSIRLLMLSAWRFPSSRVVILLREEFEAFDRHVVDSRYRTSVTQPLSYL